MSAKTPIPCLHCHVRLGYEARGLCGPCYDKPEIRNLYPRRKKVDQGYGVSNTTRRPLPAEPTNALPGSPEKIKVLEGRAAREEQLWHPWDFVDAEHRVRMLHASLSGNAA